MAFLIKLRNFVLTIFLVQKYLELIVKLMFQNLIYPVNRFFISQFSVHESTSARLLHHFRPVVAGNLAEGLVAIYNREIYNLCVGQKKTAVSCEKSKLFQREFIEYVN